MIRHFMLPAAVLWCAMFPAATKAAIQYSITNLGTLGGQESFGYGINSTGQVVGGSDTAADFYNHAYLYDGQMHDLGTFGGRGSTANDINNSGWVAGSASTTGDHSTHAYFYDGTLHDLGTFGGPPGFGSYGYGINSHGHVTGYSYLPNRISHAFIYDGTLHDIGTLGAATLNSAGYSINDLGQVTGYSDTGNYFDAGNGVFFPSTHAFLFDGTMHDLGTLTGPNGYYSVGNCINNSGWVTGASTTGFGEHAFLYDGMTMHDLGTLGGNESSGNGLNSAGTVVGSSRFTANTITHAFVYTSGIGMKDLNSLIDPLSGWELRSAMAINDAGQITGTGVIGGKTRAFLLTPVPEPSAAALLLIGTLSMVARRCGLRYS